LPQPDQLHPLTTRVYWLQKNKRNGNYWKFNISDDDVVLLRLLVFLLGGNV
jgi:hypothetical protein